MKKEYDLSDADEIYESIGVYRKLEGEDTSPVYPINKEEPTFRLGRSKYPIQSTPYIESEIKGWVISKEWVYHSFSSPIQSKNNDSSEKAKKQPGMKILSKMFKSLFMNIQKNTKIFNECSVAEVVNKVTQALCVR